MLVFLNLSRYFFSITDVWKSDGYEISDMLYFLKISKTTPNTYYIGQIICQTIVVSYLTVGPSSWLTMRGITCLAGSAQQYMGQDEFYGEQYGHTQSSSEPINQQYYPDGNHAQP